MRSVGRLEGWFFGDNELIQRYRFETSTKVINNPKVVSFDWLKSQKLDNVRKLLKDQLLRRFLEMKANIYPDLIRVFYTNLKFEGNNLVSHVKGVDTEITHDVWTVVAGLKYVGLRINKGNLGVGENFNKVQYYKSCLKNQNAQVRTCMVGGLKLDGRVLALIVTWILTPRGSNHFVLTEEDLVYIVPSRIRALTKPRSKSTSGVKVNIRRRLGEETPSASIAEAGRRQEEASPR